MIEGPSRIEQDVQKRVGVRQAIEESLALEVTLLGDGRGTPEYQKRLELRERLSRHRFVKHVVIPEILHDSYPDANPDEIERSAIEQADIVLCLEGPSHAPLGLYTEARLYFDRSQPDKWFRCQPTERPDHAGEDSLIAALADDPFIRMDTFDYDPEEWERCGRITSNCLKRVELMAAREIDRRAAEQH